jgi:hypothetical protein
MEYTSTYDADLDVVATVTAGQADLSDLIRMTQGIVDLCAMHPTANILVDHSSLDAGPISVEHLRQLSGSTLRALRSLGHRKCAHIAAGDLQFGLVRAWETLIQLADLDELETTAFRDREAAVAWLRGGG